MPERAKKAKFISLSLNDRNPALLRNALAGTYAQTILQRLLLACPFTDPQCQGKLERIILCKLEPREGLAAPYRRRLTAI